MKKHDLTDRVFNKDRGVATTTIEKKRCSGGSWVVCGGRSLEGWCFVFLLYALSTKAGTECIAHALQVLTELHPEATVTPIDGNQRVRLAFRRLSGWNVCGTTILEQCTEFSKEKAGSKVNPMMPLLFYFGQHQALQAIQDPSPCLHTHRLREDGLEQGGNQTSSMWATV